MSKKTTPPPVADNGRGVENFAQLTRKTVTLDKIDCSSGVLSIAPTAGLFDGLVDDVHLSGSTPQPHRSKLPC